MTPSPLLDGLVPPPSRPTIDWTRAIEELGWLAALDGVPQDPIHHAEGDVLVHTRRVVEALVADAEWQGLPPNDRRCLFWAALLHDVAKPACTRVEPDGRIRAPGHSARGQIVARGILWRMGMPFAERERVCHLVTHHQRPMFLVERADAAWRARQISWQTRCDWLSILARADVEGRICPEPRRLLDHVALFRELCRDAGCLEAPAPFASDHARFSYFRDPTSDGSHEPFDATRGELVLLCGMPGAGKDRWLERHSADAEVVSLDDLRESLDVAPDSDQTRVVVAAREAAKGALRGRRRLVWNATNVSRWIRRGIIDLGHDYGARIRIVYLEAPEATIRARLRRRERKVPEGVFARMLDRWEAPDPTECHRLDLLVEDP